MTVGYFASMSSESGMALLFSGNSIRRHNDGCEDQSPAGGRKNTYGRELYVAHGDPERETGYEASSYCCYSETLAQAV